MFHRLLASTLLLALFLCAGAQSAVITWSTVTGPVDEPSTAINHIGTDGASLYVVFGNNQFYRYSFADGDPLSGAWTRLADPPRLVCGNQSDSDLAYQNGRFYTSAINSSRRVLLRYDIAANSWEVWRNGNIDITVCKTTGSGMFMDPVSPGIGYSASSETSTWVRFDWNAQSSDNNWMSTQGLGVSDSGLVTRNEDVATDGAGVYYATRNDSLAGLSDGDVIYHWQGLVSPSPQPLIVKPWQSGFGQSLEYVPAAVAPSGGDELWLLRGADGSADASSGAGNPTADYARLELNNITAGWSMGRLPGPVGYNGEIVLVGSAVFVRGEGPTWYVPRTQFTSSVSDAKKAADLSAMDVEGTVSAVFGGDALFYLQDRSRACGIQVRFSGALPAVHDGVVVSGVLRTDPTSRERFVDASGWEIFGSQECKPLAMRAGSLGGASLGFQEGVYQGVGLNNVGLLVRIAGTVTFVAGDKSYAYISDGSVVEDGSGHAGVRVDLSAIDRLVLPSIRAGDSVAVTGISSLFPLNGECHRLIRARSNDDVVNYSDDGNRPKTFKVMVINFDPIIEHKGNKRLHAVYWPSHDPRLLAQYYIDDLRECSHGWANYEIVEWVDADYFPIKVDGFQYTDQTFCTAWENGGPFHSPDGVDYYRVLRDKYYNYNNPKTVAERVADGDIDEVFMFGAPYFGYWESCMCGPSPYFVNGGTYYVPEAGRNFIVMGFNYERWVGEMLEDYGHRAECIMWRVYGSWNAYPPQHNWDLFTLVDKNIVDRNLYTAGCGNVHYAPNSTADYQWGNFTYVWSTADDWLNNWPNLQGARRQMNCADWGYGDIRLHHKWWFRHFPHTAGVWDTGPTSSPNYGKQNNWWKYLADFNSYPESR